MLPLAVLEKAAAEMTDTNGSGQSVMEMSHRSKDFKAIIDHAEAMLREVMNIPANYTVLFMQGGASLQFSAIPLNLAAGSAPTQTSPSGGRSEGGKPASYVDTGSWSNKAHAEAIKYIPAKILASSKDNNYTYIPAAPKANPGDAYYYITLNNTIYGSHWTKIPGTDITGNIPLVSDISSCVISEPLDVSRFGLLFAGAQKNLGPAGVCVVIVRDDLIGKQPVWTPQMLRYDIAADNGSMYNTPPCYAIYILGLVLDWVKAQGGVEALGKRNREKAAMLYDCIDKSSLYFNPVAKADRSIMNVVFVPQEKDEEKRKALEKKFVAEAASEGLVNLGGHRSVGGWRASIYNAMPLEGVEKLVKFMQKFEQNNK
jgi:phosphoserine aminotransferase